MKFLIIILNVYVKMTKERLNDHLEFKIYKILFYSFLIRSFILKIFFIQLSSIKDILDKCIVKVKIGFFIQVIMIN